MDRNAEGVYELDGLAGTGQPKGGLDFGPDVVDGVRREALQHTVGSATIEMEVGRDGARAAELQVVAVPNAVVKQGAAIFQLAIPPKRQVLQVGRDAANLLETCLDVGDGGRGQNFHPHTGYQAPHGLEEKSNLDMHRKP